LACVAWWLLCGKPPFRAESPVALMIKHIEEPLPPLRESTPFNLSTEFEDLLLSCLRKTPLERPQSAWELGKQLRKLGSQSEDWSEEIAHTWWDKYMPAEHEPETKLTLPPLRDAVVLPPSSERA